MKSLKFVSIISAIAICSLGLLSSCDFFSGKSSGESASAPSEQQSEEKTIHSITGSWTFSVINSGDNFHDENITSIRFDSDSTFAESIKISAQSLEGDSYLMISGTLSAKGKYTFDGSTLLLVYNDDSIVEALTANEGFNPESNARRKASYAKRKLEIFRNHTIEPRKFINAKFDGDTLTLESDGKVYNFKKVM